MEEWIPNLGEVKKSTRRKGGDGATGTSVTRPHRQKKTNQHSPRGLGEPFWAHEMSSQDEIFTERDQNKKKLIISETITKVQKAT